LLVFLLLPSSAFAHGSDAAFVLLLPWQNYIYGAAFAVAASFLLLALAPHQWILRLASAEIRLFSLPRINPEITSFFAFLLLALLLSIGFFGTHDPLENLLPLTIWISWWVAFAFLQMLVGPLWPHFNPWTGPVALIRRITHSELGIAPLLRLPEKLGYGVAILQFIVFAWFENVSLAPSDPHGLASAVLTFWLLNAAGIMVFGERAWCERAEPFSIFFGLIGALSPFLCESQADTNGTIISLALPGRRLMERAAMPLSGTLFILLTLSSVSFDGVSHTFFWLSGIDINPLEFPGRSAVQVPNTLGLLGFWPVLSAMFLIMVAAGLRRVGRLNLFVEASGRLVYSLIPISAAFHIAHYFSALLVGVQYAVIAASDPFSLGWNLFGTGQWEATTSFMNVFWEVEIIWNFQTFAIVFGHVAGIAIAHIIALKLFTTRKAATISQIFLAALMVLYTSFGLWLLAAPST
jgi:hypothetical protein